MSVLTKDEIMALDYCGHGDNDARRDCATCKAFRRYVAQCENVGGVTS